MAPQRRAYFWRQPLSHTVPPLTVGATDGPLRQTSEYAALREAFQANPWLARHVDQLVGSRAARSAIDLDSLLDDVLSSLIEAAPSYEFDGNAFDHAGERLSAIFMTTEIETRRGVVLSGLALNDPIDLGDGLGVRTLTENEIGFLLDVGLMPGHADSSGWTVAETDQVALCERLLEHKQFGEQCDPPSPRRDLEECAERFRTAVRLATGGTIDQGCAFEIRDTFSDPPRSGAFGNRRLVGVSSRPAIVGQAEVAQVIDLYHLLDHPDLANTRLLQIPLRRFRDAPLRPDPADTLVDLIIAADGLLLRGKRDKLRHTLARRAAAWCALDDVSPSQVGDFMKTAYSTRSALVHGSEPDRPRGLKGEDTDLDSVVAGVEKVLRAGLVRALQEVATHGSLHLWEMDHEITT